MCRGMCNIPVAMSKYSTIDVCTEYKQRTEGTPQGGALATERGGGTERRNQPPHQPEGNAEQRQPQQSAAQQHDFL